MKTVYTFLLSILWLTAGFAGGTEPGADSTATVVTTDPGTARAISVLLYEGMSFAAEGTRFTIRELDGAYRGRGDLYFPALDESFMAEFDNLEVNAFGEILRGSIRARTQVRSEGQGAMTAGPASLPLDISPHLRARQNFSLPEGANMLLTEVEVRSGGTYVGLDFDTPTVVEDEALFFTGRDVAVDPLTFCLDGAELPVINGGGTIDDFEFPMRILAGDPQEEEEGSYVVFDCDGFQEFNLSAEYAFPRDQVVPAENSRDTVFARFRINATGLNDFVAFATVTPFEIVGVEDMVYTVDSAYVDYSDEANAVGFDWDPVAGAEPELGWKGLFLRRLEVVLPEAVGAFNGGDEMTIGGENLIYSRGNGISGNFYAYNLLDLSEGALDGWGFSIDTIETDILQNSIGDFVFLGDVFIPVFGEGDEIAYDALLGTDENGELAFTLALDVVGEYTVPFLGDVNMTLFDDSRAGVRVTSRGGFEPYLSASGKIDIELGGEMAGVTIPDVTLPGITFQDFKLNDAEMAATQAASVATAGMDRMSFGTFDFSGVNLGAAMDAINGAMDAASAANDPLGAATGNTEKKVNGKSLSIEDISFETVKIGEQELKSLKVKALINLTKGSGGISGELNLGIRGEVEYAKLISLSPWEALSYHSLEVGEVNIAGRYGNVEFGGALNIFDQDEVYGRGFKGGLTVAVNLGGTRKEMQAMGQFGTAPDGYDYFFVDMRTRFSQGLQIGSMEIVGMGGGLYVNLSKEASTRSPGFGTPQSNTGLSSTPGESFSGTTYTPRDGTVGFAVATTAILANKAEVFTADLELTMEFGEESGVRKILFDGDGYFFMEDETKKNESALKANLSMELNFERGFLSAQFAYELRSPYENPILVGGDLQGAPQGALMVDTNPEDENEYSNYFYFGKPRRPADVGLKIGDLELSVDAYVMIGSNLPDPLPLREIHPALADFPDVSRSQGNSIGFAFGVKLATTGNAAAGPIALKWDVVAGVDASIRKYSTVCSNTNDLIGMGGWYIKGRAFTYIHAEVQLHVKLNLGLTSIDKKVNLADLSVAAALVAELPNPSYLGGKIRVSGSALGFSVTKSVEVAVGEKCSGQSAYDPSNVVADVKVIDAFYPEEDSDELESFPVYDDIAVAFAYPLSYSPNQPSTDESSLKAEDDDGVVSEYFPYLKDATLIKVGGDALTLTPKWNSSNDILSLSTEDILESNADYEFSVTVRWRYRTGDEPFRDLKNNEGEYADEIKTVTFRAGPFPKTMNLKMLVAERHFPGNGQRNWHPNFGPGEIFFRKGGMDKMFNTPYPKEIEGSDEVREIPCRYEIWLTKLENEEKQIIQITERPGQVNIEELKQETVRYNVPTNDEGNTKSVSYTRMKLTSYSSKSVKYTDFNTDADLEKGKLYRFEIVRVPIQPETSISAQGSGPVVSATNVDGVVVKSTPVTLSSNVDPYYLPDVIYSFAFRVSKYDNLQQKVEQMRLVEAADGPAVTGAEHPAVKNIDRQDFLSYNLVKDMIPVSDKYFVYRIDEGFDWWERQRLNANLRVDDSNASGYYNTPKGQQLTAAIDAAQNFGRLPEAWKVVLTRDLPNDKSGIWSGVTFPEAKNNTDVSPRLTSDEIEQGEAPTTVVEKSVATDGTYENGRKWDLAIVHRGKRALTYQIATLDYMGRMFDVNYPYYTYGYAGAMIGTAARSQSNYYSHSANINGIDANQLGTLSFRVASRRYGDAYASQLNSRAVGGYGQGTVPVLATTGTLNLQITGRMWNSFKKNWFYHTQQVPISDYNYSHFRYVWSQRFNYSLPSESNIERLRQAAVRHGIRLGPISPYTAPAKFYFRDTYDSLIERVDEGDFVSKSLENIMQ